MRAPRRPIVATVTSALLAIAMLMLLTGRHPASGQVAPKPAPPQAAAVAAAAADVLKGLNERMEAGEAMTPSFADLMFEWSRRVHDAQIAAAPAKDLRVKAAQEHLARVRDLHRTLEQRFRAGLDVSRVQVAQATYYLREAEMWVFQAQAE
jgi:hypothetical protein